MDNIFLGFALVVFLAVVLFLEGMYHAWNSSKSPEAKRLQRRLRAMSDADASGQNASILKQRLLSQNSTLQQLLDGIPWIARVDHLLRQCGLSLSVAQLFALVAGCMVAGFVLMRVLSLPVLVSALAAFACSALPFLYVHNARAKRLVKFDQQLPEALDLLGRAMRAGHAFPTALRMVGDEMPEPIAGEFRIVADETNYGVAMNEALTNLCARVPSTDLRYFIIAVLIQRETGGNLVEILDNISAIIRARLKLLGTIRVLSAEGRLSAWILGVLPFAVAFLINVVNPGYMEILWTDAVGIKLVTVAGFAMAFGILWMRQIIKIRV